MAAQVSRHFALIENGLVHEIIRTEAEITDLFHPGLTLIEITEEIAIGWRWTGSAFTPPPARQPPIAAPSAIELLRAELRELRGRLDALGAG